MVYYWQLSGHTISMNSFCTSRKIIWLNEGGCIGMSVHEKGGKQVNAYNIAMPTHKDHL